MKNQNDLIVMIVSFVLAVGVLITMIFVKREPMSPPAAPTINVATPQYPAIAVSMANSLPGGGSASGGLGGPGGPGGFGGPGGPGGPGGFGGAAGGGKNMPSLGAASSPGGGMTPGVQGASTGK